MELIKKGANTQVSDAEGQVALHFACMKDSMSDVVRLLNRVGDINIANNEGCTPLHIACNSGAAHNVSLLFAKNPAINSTDQYGNTPLHCAARGGHAQILDELLTRGANSDIRNAKGLTALEVLDESNSQESRYITARKIFSEFPTKQLPVACFMGDIIKVRELLSKGANVNIKHDKLLGRGYPLTIAASHGFAEIVGELLDHKADINVKDEFEHSALHNAASKGSIETVRELLKRGALLEDVCTKGKFTLYDQGIYGKSLSLEVKKEIADMISSFASLRQSCLKGDKASVDKLIALSGGDTKNIKIDGEPLLSIAARHGDIVTMKKLVAAGIDINARDKDGNTALHGASAAGYEKAIEYLVSQEADPTLKNKKEVGALEVLLNKAWMPPSLGGYNPKKSRGLLEEAKRKFLESSPKILPSSDNQTPSNPSFEKFGEILQAQPDIASAAQAYVVSSAPVSQPPMVQRASAQYVGDNTRSKS